PAPGSALPRGAVDVPDSLGFQVLVERFQAVVAAAEAGLLVAAKRRGDVAFGKNVDRDGAGADGGGDALGAVHVLGVDRGGQAVAGVVGQADRLFLGVEAGHGQQRAEDFLAEQARVRGDVGVHGRLHVPAAQVVATDVAAG